MHYQDKAPEGKHASNTVTKKKACQLSALRVLFVVLICSAVCGAGYLIYQQVHLAQVAQEIANTPIPDTGEGSGAEGVAGEEVELPDNPIDFATLQAENNDIYAWIYVPNTNINLPVLQSSTDDNYYLTHDKDGQTAVEGAIFTQMCNATDFSDPVTVVYGHNMANSSMFATLHYFENTDFYNENTSFYIYTPGHILTYQIVSAYQYDDRHIMNSFDFSDLEELQEYFNSVCNPDSLVKNSTESIVLDAQSSKIVQLSTCVGGNLANRRYIVTGVLIDDQATK